MTDTTVIPPPAPHSPATPESWSDTQKILALTYSLAFIIVIVLCFFVSPQSNPQIFTLLTTLVGVLATQVSNIVQFYFGSTKTSQTKDQTIQALSAPTPTPPKVMP